LFVVQASQYRDPLAFQYFKVKRIGKSPQQYAPEPQAGGWVSQGVVRQALFGGGNHSQKVTAQTKR
jgi:hypothetical protein